MAGKGRQRLNAPRGGRGADMMKQLEALQTQMAEAQASLEEEVVTASVGGGAVTIEMTGAQVVRSVTIRPDVVDPDDVEMLQDLIVAAFQEAQQKVTQLTEERMKPFTSGLDVAGLL